MSNQISSKSDEEKSNLSLHGPVVFAESGFNTFYDLVYGEQYAQYGSIGLSVYMACRSFIINEFKGSLGIRYSIDPRGKSPYNNLIVIQNTSDNSSNKISDVVIEYSDPGNDITYFDDDAGGGIRISNASTGVMPWAPGTWYASVIRRWYKPGEKVTHVGFFMYDYQKDTWFHYLTVTFPCVDILFPGDDVHSMKPTGFLERNNSPAAHYSGSFGQYFAWRSGPGWYKSNTVSVTPGDCGNLWSAETAFQQTAITMSTEVPPFSKSRTEN